MAKKQKQPTKTCSDCIHESACRMWTDGRYISDSSASKCPNHETVKESSAYLCGVLDERNRKQTNADLIRAMSDEELARKRIDRIDMYTSSDLKEYIGDFAGIVNSEEEAIKKELEWLQSEAEEPHE